MIKLQQILSEIKIEGGSLKQKLIDEIPNIILLQYLIDSINEGGNPLQNFLHIIDNYNNLDELLEQEWSEEFKIKYKSLVEQFLQIFKPEELFYITERNDTKKTNISKYKFATVYRGDDEEFMVLFSNF